MGSPSLFLSFFSAFLVAASQAGASQLTGNVNKSEIRDQDGSLKGRVEQTAGATGSSSLVLSGSIKDEASLKSSITLKRRSAANNGGSNLSGSSKDTNLPTSTEVAEFRGGTQYRQGMPVLAPRSPDSVHIRSYGVIPPIYDYDLKIQTGVHSVPSVFTVTPSRTQRGVATWAPGFEVQSNESAKAASSVKSSVKGVTVWIEGYGVVSSGSGNARTTSNGITVVSSEYATKPVEHSSNFARARDGGIVSWSPGHQVSVSSEHQGIVCWAPGYEVSISNQSVTRTALSGLWYAPPAAQGLKACQGKLLPAQQYAQVIVEPVPLTATALLLPELRQQATASSSGWDDWYQRVGQVIYSRWVNVEVGPGIARLKVTIDQERRISCQVTEFIPLVGVQRDAVNETLFRESALNAVKQISAYELPLFPSGTTAPSMSFEIDMKRQVEGVSGVDIASQK